MNNEQQQIINKVYEDALMEYGFKSLPSTPTGTWFETIETFIHKCKIDNEFSNKWGLQIEERELSEEERYDLCAAQKSKMTAISEEDYIKYNIPTKVITITYNDKAIESYE